MKKYLFLAIAATVLASCSKPEAPVPTEDIDPNTVIEYTSHYGERVEPYSYNDDTTAFGAKILSNTYQVGVVIATGIIKFDDSVTHIGDRAFYKCSLRSIKIPDSVTSIGNYAFYHNNLGYITLPESVISIGNNAFQGCYNLYSINWGNNIQTIGDLAFFLTGLGDIVIPDSVTSIGKSAFFECFNLTHVVIGNGVRFIDDEVFRKCEALNSITLGNNIQAIGDYTFYQTGLFNIVIPDSVTSIGKSAFGNCMEIKKAVVGKRVKTIGKDAFSGCNKLKEIYCKSQEPPFLGSETALGDPQNSVNYKIYVPKGAVDAYKSAWSHYSDYIVEYDFN